MHHDHDRTAHVGYQRPRGAGSMTQAEKEALVDRSEYTPKDRVPEHYDERFWVTCNLCGREVTVTLNNLQVSDKDRAARSDSGPAPRRQRCFHPKDALPARPPLPQHPGLLNATDAAALLAALGPEPETADRVLVRARRRLAHLAQGRTR